MGSVQIMSGDIKTCIIITTVGRQIRSMCARKILRYRVLFSPILYTISISGRRRLTHNPRVFCGGRAEADGAVWFQLHKPVIIKICNSLNGLYASTL